MSTLVVYQLQAEIINIAAPGGQTEGGGPAGRCELEGEGGWPAVASGASERESNLFTK